MVIEPIIKNSVINNLEDLSVYRFDKCVKGDLKYLYTDNSVNITDDLKKLWEKLYTEYCELIGNTNAIYLYVLATEINYLHTKISICNILLENLVKIPNKKTRLKYIKELSAWGLPIDMNKPLYDEIKKIEKVLVNVNTKLKRKNAEYKDYIDDNGEDTGKTITIYDEKTLLERILKKNHIDIKKINVLEWISYWKEVKKLKVKKQK